MGRVRIAILISVMLMALAALHADAQTKCDWRGGFNDGNFLRARLKGDHMDQAYAMAYIAGCLDSYYLITFALPECTKAQFQFPRDGTLKQATKVVENYLERNPGRWHLGAPTLIYEAMTETFPCH